MNEPNQLVNLSTAPISGLRCKGCRALILDNTSIFGPNHESSTTETRRSKMKLPCSHYFLDGDAILTCEPLKWLEDQIQTGEPEGTICCWKCSQKLGTFNWKGALCGCGAWQIPAIGIIKSKVDPIKRTSNE